MDNFDSMEYLNQARYFLGAEQYDDALECIEKAIECDKLNKELYIQKSIILANMDKYDEAAESANNALKIDNSYAEAYFHLGNIYLMNNQQTLGIENYNKAIANGYNDAQIYFNLGLMYEEDENYELALRNYSKAILLDSLRVDARVRKAELLISNNKYQEALETVNELILADPELYEGYHLKSLLLAEMKDFSHAIETLDEGIKLFPKDPSFIIDKINIFVMKGDYDVANSLVKKLETEYEMDLKNKRHLELEKARLFAIKSDINSIINCLNKAKEYSKEIDPENVDVEALFLLSSCYLETKDYQGAISVSKELINSEVLAYAIPAYYTLPYSYSQNGESEKAALQYKESIDKLRAITLENPELLDAYIFRALCLKEIGNHEKALEICNYLVKIDNNSKVFHSTKAEVLYAMGNEDEAKAEKALAESLQ